jgi:hypothetical protein
MRRALLVTTICALAALAFACGDGGDGGDPLDVTPFPTATEGVPETATPSGPNEFGEAPVYWRTLDDFASLQAGAPYTVLFRVTNGYAEPTLTITAKCLDCESPSERQPVEFEAPFSPPVGEDAPGSYYPVNITLPFPGQWELSIVTGDTETTIPVEAASGAGSAG